ncbi:hypothetical protein VE04_10349, partial [Pseudogymnoascus sp. 24MN13]
HHSNPKYITLRHPSSPNAFSSPFPLHLLQPKTSSKSVINGVGGAVEDDMGGDVDVVFVVEDVLRSGGREEEEEVERKVV